MSAIGDLYISYDMSISSVADYFPLDSSVWPIFSKCTNIHRHRVAPAPLRRDENCPLVSLPFNRPSRSGKPLDATFFNGALQRVNLERFTVL
ncbi:MAG: hypothetical protein QOF48_4003 [Verrucomicrobiota bacterium]